MSKKILSHKINKADFACRNNYNRTRPHKKIDYYIEIGDNALENMNGAIRIFSRARKARSLARHYKKQYPHTSVKLIKIVSRGEWDFFIPYEVRR